METLWQNGWHLLSAIVAISVPILILVGKSYLNIHNRLIQAETRLEERSKTLKEVSDIQVVDSHRISRNESTVASMQDSLQEFRNSIDRRLTDLGNRMDMFGAKLEVLPTISAHLENLANLSEKIVLREVHETQLAALGDRMLVVEERVNKAKRTRVTGSLL
jgi:hypothetical protein